HIALFWHSPSQPWAVIPTSQLYPASLLTASLNAPGVAGTGAPAENFTVTYTDNTPLNLGSLNGGEISVSGPDGFTQNATLTDVTQTSPTTWDATYQITPQGGSWTAADAGTYTVALVPGVVSDTANAQAAGGLLGSFQVNA